MVAVTCIRCALVDGCEWVGEVAGKIGGCVCVGGCVPCDIDWPRDCPCGSDYGTLGRAHQLGHRAWQRKAHYEMCAHGKEDACTGSCVEGGGCGCSHRYHRYNGRGG